MMEVLTTLLWTLAVVAAVAAMFYFTRKFWQGQRTQVFGSILTVAGYVQTADLGWLPDNIEGPIMFGAGLLVIFLRRITKTPVGVKEEDL